MVSTNTLNLSRLKWDLNRLTTDRYDSYWKERDLSLLPPHLFKRGVPVWLEIGAGSGWFVVELAMHYPTVQMVAIERSRERGRRLIRRALRSGLGNLAAFRGNAIPALIHEIPSESIDRIYLLYPCPWPKTSQRKNRWYLHPVMPHLVRILRPRGLILWASDQKFFIDEANFVCVEKYSFESLVHQELAANSYNDLGKFPGGRTKFERAFLGSGHRCHELVVRKS